MTNPIFKGISTLFLLTLSLHCSAQGFYSPSNDDPIAMDDSIAVEQQPRGVVRSIITATISSEIASQITKLPFREGQTFQKGDLLVEFDCRRFKADYRAARSNIDIRQRTVETNEELAKFQSIGKYELLISVAELNKAKAEADSLKIALEGCQIFAPFNGRVSERLANRFEAVTQAQPIISILSIEDLELEIIIPSDWLNWLTAGMTFTFNIDETGQQVDAEVVRLYPEVDPVSKSIKVIGNIKPPATEDSHPLVLPGMSGSAVFNQQEEG